MTTDVFDDEALLDQPPPPTTAASNGHGKHATGTGLGLRTIAMANVEATVTEWVWKGRLPRGSLTMLQGDPGVGKTWVHLAMATALSLGAPLPGDTVEGHGSPCDTLLFCAEDDPSAVLRPRLDYMGADPARVVLADTVGEDALFSLKDHVGLLDVELGRHPYALVVFDPLEHYIGGGVDTWKSTDLREVLGPLMKVISRHHVACLAISHLGKGSKERAIYRGLGSIALPALARVVLHAAKDPDNDHRGIIACVKNNLGIFPPAVGYELAEGTLAWLAGYDHWTAEALNAPPLNPTDIAGANECRQDLLELLERSPGMDGRTLAAQLRQGGHNEASIQRARSTLRAHQLIERSAEGGGANLRYSWALTDDGQVALDETRKQRAREAK